MSLLGEESFTRIRVFDGRVFEKKIWSPHSGEEKFSNDFGTIFFEDFSLGRARYIYIDFLEKYIR